MKSIKPYKEETRIALLEQSINHINQTLIRIENKLENFEKRFDKIDDRFDKIHNRIWTLFMWTGAGFVAILGVIARAQHWL